MPDLYRSLLAAQGDRREHHRLANALLQRADEVGDQEYRGWAKHQLSFSTLLPPQEKTRNAEEALAHAGNADNKNLVFRCSTRLSSLLPSSDSRKKSLAFDALHIAKEQLHDPLLECQALRQCSYVVRRSEAPSYMTEAQRLIDDGQVTNTREIEIVRKRTEELQPRTR
jgi:hypothetical protein